PALAHSPAMISSGSVGYPSSSRSAKTSTTDEQPRMRAALITSTLRSDDSPLGVSQTRAGRGDLRPVRRAPAVFPQSAGGNHTGTAGDGDHHLRSDLRDSVRPRVVVLADTSMFGFIY